MTSTNPSPVQVHLLGKRRRQELSGTIHEAASAPVSHKSRRMMELMGWSEGTGLGKRRDGRLTHIATKKRVEQSGLGSSDSSVVHKLAQEGEWWKNAVGNTLAKLGSKSKRKKRQADSGDKPATYHCTDEDLFRATGGKRFGMRAAPTSNLHKWKRTEPDANVATVVSDGAPATAPAEPTESGPTELPESKQPSREKRENKRKKKRAKRSKKRSESNVD